MKRRFPSRKAPFLYGKQNKKVQNEHIYEPNVMQKQDHSRKFGNAIEARSHRNRKAKNDDAEQNRQKNQPQ